MPKTYKLSEYEVKEISLVHEGAVNEKYIITKSKGESMPNLLEKIEKLEIDAPKLEELSKKFSLNEDEKEMLSGIMKLRKAETDNLRNALNEMDGVKKVEGEEEKDGKKELAPEMKELIEKEKEPLNKKIAEITKEKDEVIKEKDKVTKEIKELKEKETKATYIGKAKEFKKLAINVEKFADVLRYSDELLPKDISVELNRVLKTADIALESGKPFGEIGSGKEGDTNEDKYEGIAQERSKSKNITIEAARAEVMNEHPDYYKQLKTKGDKNAK
jgi:hypothetical protein